MKCIILAAGYATRLYPLTKNFPKPLLDVKGKSILDWLVGDIDSIGEMDEIIIVTNHKFIQHFTDWKDKAVQEKRYHKKLTVVDDGSTANENRLGAVKDIAYVLQYCHISDDILVVAGDNLIDFSFKGFVAYFTQKNAACIMRHFEPSPDKLRKTGVAMLDHNDRLFSMQEKPEQPQSNWAVPPFYIYTKKDLSVIIEAVACERCEADAPGDFIAWFCQEHEVYAYEMPGHRYDVGDLQSYERIKRGWKV